jgi:hypothetical protein
MSFTVHCPACREKKRVPDNAAGGRVQCFKCGTMFTVAREASLLEAPAVMDGAIAGALAGTAAGIVVGATAGVIDGRMHGSAFGGAMLGGLGNGFLGLIVGFSIGVIGGCLLGIAIRFALPALESRPRQAALLLGVLLGAVVAAVIRDLYWALPGAVLGAGAASLWPVLRRRLHEMTPPPPGERVPELPHEAEVGGEPQP